MPRQEWAFLLGMAAFGLVGLVYFLLARPDRRFTTQSAAMAPAAAPAAGEDRAAAAR